MIEEKRLKPSAMTIVDAVAHCYNWTRENWAVPEAEQATAAGVGFHSLLSVDDSSRLSPDEFARNWSVEELEEAFFLESPVDLIAYHGTPIWDFFKDGHSDTEKGFELKQRNPDRVLVYGAVNPFHGKRAVRDLEKLVERGVDGIKVYAARYHEGKTYEQRLDDKELGYPFIERALELGVKVIATHKAVPFGPVRSEPYGVSDIPEVCAVFPEMNFEIVHSGFAFVEDTAFLAGFPNCWLNLEVSAALIYHAPRRVAEFLGQFILMGGGDRILFASGCALTHPAPLIQAFLDFEMPHDLVANYGYPELTDVIKRGFLGENFLRLHDIDPTDLKARIADDQWSQHRSEGLAEPWSNLRGRTSAAVS